MSGCFYCRHHYNPRPHSSGIGWAYSCRQGLDTAVIADNPEAVVACPAGDAWHGFQIGGYYRHMWFEGAPANAEGDESCLELHIEGDADFPQNGETQFHLCDFRQLEEWVQFWGKELRRRGWVVDDEPPIEKEEK